LGSTPPISYIMQRPNRTYHNSPAPQLAAFAAPPTSFADEPRQPVAAVAAAEQQLHSPGWLLLRLEEVGMEGGAMGAAVK
jgi:hypothetical protein